MEKDSGKIFRELKDDVSTYVELKLELLKLSTYERSGQLIAILSYGLILLFLAFFAIRSIWCSTISAVSSVRWEPALPSWLCYISY